MKLLLFNDRAAAVAARRLIGRAMGCPFPAVRATEGVHIEPAVVGDRWCKLRRVRGETMWLLFVDADVVAMADPDNNATLRTRLGANRRTEFRALIAGASEIDVPWCDDDDDANAGTTNA